MLGIMLLASCGVSRPPEVAGEGLQPGQSPLSATSVGLRWLKPPLKVLYFDITMHNPASETRWLVLPDTLPDQGQSEPSAGGEVSEVQAWLLSEEPRVVMAEAYGSFQAVRLPAGAELTLRRLAIRAWWEEVPSSAVLEMLVVRAFLVGGVPLEKGLDLSVDSESGADVSAPTGGTDSRALASWHPGPLVPAKPGSISGSSHMSVPVTLDVESRVRVEFTLSTLQGPP